MSNQEEHGGNRPANLKINNSADRGNALLIGARIRHGNVHRYNAIRSTEPGKKYKASFSVMGVRTLNATDA